MSLLKAAAVYVLNCVLAVILTVEVTSPFHHLPRFSDPVLVMHRELFLSAVGAFGVGFSVYWTWRQPASKWVWVAGAFWFAWRAVPLWLEQRAMPFEAGHTLFGWMSGGECSSRFLQSCLDAIYYSVPSVRVIFFSAGAYCASPLPRFHFDGLRKVFPGLFKLIGEGDVAAEEKLP
jgi:hypothetical protein